MFLKPKPVEPESQRAAFSSVGKVDSITAVPTLSLRGGSHYEQRGNDAAIQQSQHLQKHWV